jgi:uncharacterized membrane protein required for colicin V production
MSASLVIDVVALVYILFAMFHGIRRGLSGELAGAVSTVVALVAAFIGYRVAGETILQRTRLNDGFIAYLLGFVLVLCVAYLLMLLVRLVLRSLMELKFRGPLEKAGGGVAGLVRAVVVVVVLVAAVNVWDQGRLQEVFAESHVGRFVGERLLPFYRQFAADHPEFKLPGAAKAAEETAEDPEQP